MSKNNDPNTIPNRFIPVLSLTPPTAPHGYTRSLFLHGPKRVIHLKTYEYITGIHKAISFYLKFCFIDHIVQYHILPTYPMFEICGASNKYVR